MVADSRAQIKKFVLGISKNMVKIVELLCWISRWFILNRLNKSKSKRRKWGVKVPEHVAIIFLSRGQMVVIVLSSATNLQLYFIFWCSLVPIFNQDNRYTTPDSKSQGIVNSICTNPICNKYCKNHQGECMDGVIFILCVENHSIDWGNVIWLHNEVGMIIRIVSLPLQELSRSLNSIGCHI